MRLLDVRICLPIPSARTRAAVAARRMAVAAAPGVPTPRHPLFRVQSYALSDNRRNSASAHGRWIVTWL